MRQKQASTGRARSSRAVEEELQIASGLHSISTWLPEHAPRGDPRRGSEVEGHGIPGMGLGDSVAPMLDALISDGSLTSLDTVQRDVALVSMGGKACTLRACRTGLAVLPGVVLTLSDPVDEETLRTYAMGSRRP